MPDADKSVDECVLTNGDLRLANIMIAQNSDGNDVLSGIIDWKYCGWYPAWWEGVKSMNCVDAGHEEDCMLLMPDIISPSRYPINFFVNLARDRHVLEWMA